MLIKTATMLLATCIVLTGCRGPGEMWEHTTYGVRDSKWYAMTEAERYYARKTYEDQQYLKKQEKVEKKIQSAEKKLQNLKMKNAQLENDKIKAETREIKEYKEHPSCIIIQESPTASLSQ